MLLFFREYSKRFASLAGEALVCHVVADNLLVDVGYLFKYPLYLLMFLVPLPDLLPETLGYVSGDTFPFYLFTEDHRTMLRDTMSAFTGSASALS